MNKTEKVTSEFFGMIGKGIAALLILRMFMGILG